MNTTNLIEIKKLSYSYSINNHALKNINLSIKKGSFVSIVGHNGSGKSTLAKILAGLYHIKKGEYLYNGKNIKELSFDEFRKKVSVVFQNPDNQFIASSVEEDIAFGLENNLIPREKMIQIVDEFATRVGMKQYLNKEPSELSGGQKQRVAIAGVLALAPEFVIFDEATSMLDPRGRKDIRKLINELRNENKDMTFVSITHDIEEAFNSDYIYVLSKGRLVMSATPKELINKEDELAKLGINIPNFYKLKSMLKKDGIDVESANNIDELGDILCQ